MRQRPQQGPVQGLEHQAAHATGLLQKHAHVRFGEPRRQQKNNVTFSKADNMLRDQTQPVVHQWRENKDPFPLPRQGEWVPQALRVRTYRSKPRRYPLGPRKQVQRGSKLTLHQINYPGRQAIHMWQQRPTGQIGKIILCRHPLCI